MKRKKKIILIVICAVVALIITTILILNNDRNPANDLDRNIPGIKPKIPSSTKNHPQIDEILALRSELIVTINQDSAFVIIDSLQRGKITGHYYLLTKNSNNASAEPFDIELRYNNTTAHLNGEEYKLDIPARKLEVYLDGKRHNANMENHRRATISVNPYNEPYFHATDDQRYKKSLYKVQVDHNIKYAEARGFWTSMIDDEHKGYADVLTRSLKDIRKMKDLDLTLDLYRPIDSLNTPHPFLLFIHGGAFYIGDKTDTTTVIMCRHFASMGYYTASIDYRMGFLPSKNEIDRTEYMALQDAHAAMRFLLATDSLHLINEEQLFVGGSSAGSMIALNLAFMTNHDRPEVANGKKRRRRFPELGEIESSGNKYTNVFDFKAVANLWGGMADLNIMQGSKTEIISFHGDADKLVPYSFGYPFAEISKQLGKRLVGAVYGSAAIDNRAKQIGLRSHLTTFEGYGHAPQFNEDKTLNKKIMQTILDNTTCFFYESIVPEYPTITPSDRDPRLYVLNGGDFKDVEWKVEGGFFTDLNDKNVSVIWFDDAPEQKISATFHHPSGLDFTIHYKNKSANTAKKKPAIS